MQQQFDSDPEDEIDELPIFDPSQKKKKKSKNKPIAKKDSFDAAVDHALAIHAGNEHEHIVRDSEEDLQFNMDPIKESVDRDPVGYFDELADSFQFGKKKKKRKKKKEPVKKTESNSDDYDYYDLLNKIYDKIGRSDDKSSGKINLPPIQISKLGTTKTVWCNIKRIAISLHRETEHLQKYTVTELAVNGNMNGSDQLVVKGRFQTRQIENSGPALH